MRSLLDWLTPRRLVVAIGLIALILIGAVSAGRTPESDEWVRVPNLNFVVAIVVISAAALGLGLILYAGPKQRERMPGERRTVKTLMFFVVALVIIALLMEPPEPGEEPPPPEQEQVIDTGSEPAPPPPETGFLGATGPELLALAVVVLLVTAIVVRSLTRKKPEIPEIESSLQLDSELAPAVEQAHRHLSEETDPRTAVLLAYAALEKALSDLGHPREEFETPSEHMARVLVDYPMLASPAIRLGRLYELARFSESAISGSDRDRATDALDKARITLPTPEAT